MTPRALVMAWAPRVLLAVLALAVLGALVRFARAAPPASLPARLRRRPVLALGWALGALAVGLELARWAGLATELRLRAARPWMALVTWAALWWLAARLTGASGAARRWLHDAVVVLTVLALGGAAGGLELGRPLDRLTVVLAVDRSRSTELVPGAEQRIELERRAAEASMLPRDLVATVVFGAEAVTEESPRDRDTPGAGQRAVVGRDGTDLAAGLRRALAEVPSDSAARVVLVSDGVATRGDVMGAAAAALAAGIPVDVLPLEQKALSDLRVVALRGPPRADEGEDIELRVVTSSTAPAEVSLVLERDGVPIAKGEGKVGAGEDVLRLRDKAPAPGLHRYEVKVTAKDPSIDLGADDNEGATFVRVRGPANALVLDGDAGATAFVARALRDAAFVVTEGGAARIPLDLGELAAWDLLVLSDVRASDLSEAQLHAIASWVRDLGGGLVLLGGDRSMGPGGYARTPVEEVSPVSFDLKQERRRASLAEVIGIDVSGSMGAKAGGRTKLELANEGAARSAALLGEGDLLGVAHVDTAVKWSVPLAPLTDKAAVERAIRGAGVGGGGIYVDVTLRAAYDALARQTTMLKHVLLFADGSDAENMTGCRAMVSAALAAGVTTSVVALGRGYDVPELEVLSQLGNGRFYLVEDATRLPAIFSQETVLAARSSLVEKPFRAAKAQASAVLAGVDVGALPELAGYVVTIPKPRATVALTGLDGDPLLAHWPAGVGHAAAFTSDWKNRWGAQFTQSPHAARLVAQVAREVARKGDDPRVRVDADTVGGELHLRASVVDDAGRSQSFRRLVARVAGPSGFSREVTLDATGAGSYSAVVPLSRPGTYLAAVRDEVGGELLGTAGAALSAGEELRPTGTDFAVLSRVAELTGGRRRDTLAGLFRDRGPRRIAYEDLSRTLAAVGAVLLVLLVAARRLSAPLWLTSLPSKARAWAARRPAEARAPSPGTSMVDALARVRSREPRTDASLSPSTVPLVVPPLPAAPPAAGGATPRVSTPSAASPTGSVAPASGPSSQRSRPLSAAEVLLARKRSKRG